MIKIYTDGSCIGNPGTGGWAAIIFLNNKKIKIKGKKKNTTNNQMELMAPIEALKKIPVGKKVQIYTDSKYVKMGITEWIKSWKKNNWKTYNKKKVKNIDLWKELDHLSEKYQIKWLWIKGHSGDVINEEADQLAKEAANLN
jgi:ribonuclease HI